MKFHLSSWTSEILHFGVLILSKSYKVSAKKVQKTYLSWHWRMMQFTEKLTCGFKYDMRNLVHFHPTTQTSKIFTLMGRFRQKYEVWAKKYRGVFFHDTKQWCKIGINPALMVSKMAWGLGWTFIRAPKSQIGLFYIVGLFLSKAYNVSVRKFQRNYVSQHWRVFTKFKGKLICGLKMT